MNNHGESPRNLEQGSGKETAGWTSTHSWIFLVIVALGFVILGWQNRYHYLSPLGLGKAYRIDKLFGGIQEFDPSGGWINAQLQSMGPPQAMSMMEPPPQGSHAVPMNMPGSARMALGTGEAQIPAGPDVIKESTVESGLPKETPLVSEVTQTPPPQVKTTTEEEPSKEQRQKSFQSSFPEFGQEEFQLANDDLYPDWKKTVVPGGNWNQFLSVYKDFLQWWNDAGSPPEPGFKLWKDFLAGAADRKKADTN